MHFLVQSVPSYSPTKIARTIKSITAREIFRRAPKVKRKLGGGEFWGKGCFITTVGRHGSEDQIRRYVEAQGSRAEYEVVHQNQLDLRASEPVGLV